MNVFPPLEKRQEAFVKLPLMLICILGITLLSAANAAETSNQATHADTATDGKATSGKKMKCRRIKQLGTNITRKVCDTRENWEALNNKNRGAVDDYTRRIQERATLTTPANVDPMGGVSSGALGSP